MPNVAALAPARVPASSQSNAVVPAWGYHSACHGDASNVLGPGYSYIAAPVVYPGSRYERRSHQQRRLKEQHHGRRPAQTAPSGSSTSLKSTHAAGYSGDRLSSFTISSYQSARSQTGLSLASPSSSSSSRSHSRVNSSHKTTVSASLSRRTRSTSRKRYPVNQTLFNASEFRKYRRSSLSDSSSSTSSSRKSSMESKKSSTSSAYSTSSAATNRSGASRQQQQQPQPDVLLSGLFISAMTLNERPPSRRGPSSRASFRGSELAAGSSRFELEDEDNESDERKEAWISQVTKLDDKFYLKDDEVAPKVKEDADSKTDSTLGRARTTTGQMEIILKRAS